MNDLQEIELGDRLLLDDSYNFFIVFVLKMKILEELIHLLFADLSVHGSNVLRSAVGVGEEEPTNTLADLLAELVAIATESLFLEMIHQVKQDQRVIPFLIL